MNSTSSVSVGADLPNSHGGSGGRRPPRRQMTEAEALTSLGHRLEIRQDPESGAWVYTVTDRDTGEILMQREREDVARLGQTPDYAAGTLIKAKA